MLTTRSAQAAAIAGLMAAWPSIGTGQALATGRTGHGTIAGIVVVRGTDHPVAGASVSVIGLQPRATSDERGTFVFAGVPPGTHTVAAEADGYKAASVEVVVVAGVTARVTVALEADPLRIEEQVDVLGRLPRGSEAQPGTAFTLTGTRVTTISGTLGNFGRTLRSVPAAAGTSDERNSVVARGGNPIENGFYIDNVEVPNVSHLPDWGSTGGFYSLVDPFMVNAFDFVVGGFPARFGGHLSSVTDMTYREGSRDRIRGQARFDIAMAAVGAEGPLPGKRGAWRASVRHADFIYLKEITWNVSGTFVVQDGTPYTPTHEELSAAWGIWVRRAGEYNTLCYPVYASLNVRVERRFHVGRTILAAYVDCWNLLGRQNVGWIEGWNAETGDVFKYQMPRTPFIGVGVVF